MNKSFETLEAGDGRIFVILHVSCTASRDDILKLLEVAGIERDKVTFLETDDARDFTELDDAVVLIPINGETCDVPELEDVGRQCGQAGGRVVVIFEEGFAFSDLHPIAEKYGTQCSWSGEDLGQCVSGKDPERASDSEGNPVPRSGVKQVNC
ncbi:hypothetical protein [Sphingopyxis sp. NJF-3]